MATEGHEDGYLRPVSKTLDCSIMDLADDIAYGVYDFEDGITLNLIRKADCKQVFEKAKGCSLEGDVDACWHETALGRKIATSHIVRRLIGSVQFVTTNENFSHHVLRYRARLGEPEYALLGSLKSVVRDSSRVISSDPEHLLPVA